MTDMWYYHVCLILSSNTKIRMMTGLFNACKYPNYHCKKCHPLDSMHKRGICCRKVPVCLSVCHDPALHTVKIRSPPDSPNNHSSFLRLIGVTKIRQDHPPTWPLNTNRYNLSIYWAIRLVRLGRDQQRGRYSVYLTKLSVRSIAHAPSDLRYTLLCSHQRTERGQSDTATQ